MKKKKILIFVLIFLIIIAPFGFTLGRYVILDIKNYIMESNNFFFSSDKLEYGGITYEINNWGGADNVEIQFQLNNHKNNLLSSAGNIAYTLETSCDDTVICSLNSSSGILFESEVSDNFVLTVVPQTIFNDNESVTVTVSATSSTPYVKTLEATFVITVGKRGVSYEITDSVASPYLLFKITNAIDTYQVITAFDSYHVGDTLTTNEYISLSETNKSKCASILITLTFDPTVVVLDTTSSILKNTTNINHTNVDGVNYISSVTFPIDILSSNEVRFYKNDVSQNYTYPFETSSPIISFSAS